MDVLDILRRTGGLPPSAFSIRPNCRLSDTKAGMREEDSIKDEGIVHYRNFDTVLDDSFSQATPFKSTSAQEGSGSNQLEPFLNANSLNWMDNNAVTPSPQSRTTIHVSTLQELTNRPLRRRCNLSDDTKYALEKVFSQTPYPDRDMLAQVSSYTGLSITKVTTWFNNNRSRRLKRSM